jgi:8-oxo-dGTP pyrophosphatase MutT (NUDIX family)
MTPVFSNKSFNLFLNDDYPRLQLKYKSVLLLPYILDSNNKIDKILLLNEPYLTRTYQNNIIAPITGTIENGETLVQTIVRELWEEGGIELKPDDIPTRIDNLGYIYTNKWSNEKYYCFGINITGLERSKPKGDGSKKEKNIEINEYNPKDVIDIRESLVLSSVYLLLYNKI